METNVNLSKDDNGHGILELCHRPARASSGGAEGRSFWAHPMPACLFGMDFEGVAICHVYIYIIYIYIFVYIYIYVT